MSKRMTGTRLTSTTMGTLIKYSILTSIFTLLVLSITVFTSFAREDLNSYKTGLKEPTSEQLDWMKKNFKETKNIKLNSIGKQRIIDELEKKKSPKDVLERIKRINSAPIGQEVQSTSSASDSDNELLSISEMIRTLPGSVDNSQLKYFPPIRSQGAVGSCACFSTTYYQFTYMNALARGWDAKNSDDSKRFSPKWTYNMVNGGVDKGSWMSEAYEVLLKNGGATWSDFPYDSNFREWSTDANVWRNAINYRIDSMGTVNNLNTADGLNNLKLYLNNGYVLVFATYIKSWQYTTIKDDLSTAVDDKYVGKYICHSVNGSEGGHAMTIVGYDDNIWTDLNNNNIVDSGEKGALRIANSWGNSWQDGGFTWISYNAVRNGALWYNGAYWITAKSSYSPKLLAEFTINTKERNKISCELGYSSLTQTTPAGTWNSAALSYDGGPYAFNGTTTASDGNFVLDYTELLNQNGINLNTKLRYYLNVNDNAAGNPTVLKIFKIINCQNGDTVANLDSLPLSVDSGLITSSVDYGLSSEPYLSSVSLSGPTNALFGSTVTYTATASYSNCTPKYDFWYQEPNGNWVGSGFSTSNTFTITNLKAGTYKVVVYAISSEDLAIGNESNKKESNVITLTVAQLNSISITPASKTLNALHASGGQINVIASYSDNSTKDVTEFTDFKSSNTNIAQVYLSGSKAFVWSNNTYGTATITASYQGKTAICTVKVIPSGKVDSVSLSGPISGTVGGSATYTATASYSGCTPKYDFWYQDPNGTWIGSGFTTSRTFTLSNLKAGTYKVVVYAASSQDLDAGIDSNKKESNVITLTVAGSIVQLNSISVSPTSVTINGLNLSGGAIKVTAAYSDGSTKDVTGSAAFTSSNSGIAYVSGATIYSGSTAGKATITASYQGKTATCAVTVISGSSGQIYSVSLYGPTSGIIGGTVTYTATASYSNCIPKYQLWYLEPGGDPGNWPSQPLTTSNYFTLSNLKAGTYKIVVNAITSEDAAAGNWSKAVESNVITLTVSSSSTTGKINSVVLSGPISGTAGGSVTYTATTSYYNCIPKYQLWYLEPGGDPSNWPSQPLTTSHTFTLNNLKAGTYKIVVNAITSEDAAAGNWSKAVESNVITLTVTGGR